VTASSKRALPPSPEYYRRFIRGWVGADESFPIIVRNGKYGPTRGHDDVTKRPAVYVGAAWLEKQAIPREALA